MCCAANMSFANRQVILHRIREVLSDIFHRGPEKLGVRCVYDIAHNIAKIETHDVAGEQKRVCVHRKGATRAFGPGHPELPSELQAAGQPVLIGGTMGTASYILAGTAESMQHAYGSACHGAGRSMSRRKAQKSWQGRQVVDELAHRNILIRSPSLRGVAEEAPGAYKDISAVVEAADHAGLACLVARLEPMVCIKG